MREKNMLLMPFEDSSESFTNGFECGQIWEKLQSNEKLNGYLIHSCNIKQIKKIAETFMTLITIKETSDEEWSLLYTKDFEMDFFNNKPPKQNNN